MLAGQYLYALTNIEACFMIQHCTGGKIPSRCFYLFWVTDLWKIWRCGGIIFLFVTHFRYIIKNVQGFFKKSEYWKANETYQVQTGFPILAKTKPATFSPSEMRANQWTREFKRNDVLYVSIFPCKTHIWHKTCCDYKNFIN